MKAYTVNAVARMAGVSVRALHHHRELGIPLAEVGAILDASGFDRLGALRKQRNRLQEQAARYAEMVRTIDRTISRLKGERAMKDANLYEPLRVSRRLFGLSYAAMGTWSIAA